jgi:pyruvate/2-oxoacid:ferredoxin oxidoreductase beta subunit
LDIHSPITEIKQSRKSILQNAKPWITKNILKLIKVKDKTYKKLINETDEAKKVELQNKYKEQKNEITKLTRKSKKLHFNEYFAKNNRNMKKLWAGINQIINKKTILATLQFVLKLTMMVM